MILVGVLSAWDVLCLGQLDRAAPLAQEAARLDGLEKSHPRTGFALGIFLGHASAVFTSQGIVVLEPVAKGRVQTRQEDVAGMLDGDLWHLDLELQAWRLCVWRQLFRLR